MARSQGFEDVFVSHRGLDTKRGFASWLRRDLERRLFTCFLDERSLRRGDDSWPTIMEALSSSKLVVIVLSKGFFESKWCLRELHLCRALGKKVVPVFFDVSPDECGPADLAANIPPLPWAGGSGDWDGVGWEEDVQWIKGITGLRLEALDGFWDTCIDEIIQDVARLLGRPAVDLLTKVDTTPFGRNKGFVGRGEELVSLEEIMREDGMAFVTGIGGMGKTQLLLEYVNRHRGRYAKVLWIDGTSQTREANFIGLAEHLGVQLEKEGVDALAANIRKVKDALERAEAPYLLVMDNVDEEEGLWDMLPNVGICQVLVSTRLNQLSDMQPVHLKELGEGDALKLLIGKEKALLAGKEDLLRLANRLGRLTLALAVSSRILADKVTPKELLDRIDQKGVEVFEKERNDLNYGLSPNLVHLFDISMERVRNAHGDLEHRTLAEAMVKVGGWFASAPIPFHLLRDAAVKTLPEAVKDGAEAFRLLVRYSLGDRIGEGGSLASFHQLVQEYGRFLAGQEAGKAVVSALSEEKVLDAHSVVHYQYAYDLTIPGTGLRDIDLGEDGRASVVQRIGIPLVYHYVGAGFDLTRACTLVGTFSEGNSEALRAEILACRGGVSREMGQYGAAYQNFEEALGIKERECLHEGVQCDKCLIWPIKGSRYKALDQDEYDLCASCMDEQGLGSKGFVLVEHPSVATTLGNMAVLLQSQGKYEEALPLYERSLRINLPLYERDLRISEKALGPEHPDVATTAGLLRSQGKYEGAAAVRARRPR
eukprot:TRINITY_DN431_c0_g1_i14.p1 TRINITY_DN431_c0_g1~~TRINITY_DN431_c0_g1_i14.p1  ORF type:complete len:767 (+),score=194.19 TRINITY_DN431_c0_g1_i14:430-2730(+)